MIFIVLDPTVFQRAKKKMQHTVVSLIIWLEEEKAVQLIQFSSHFLSAGDEPLSLDTTTK